MANHLPDWHREAITPAVEQAAAELGAKGILDGFYLAGGTGLALHLGHRRSVDLDFFRQEPFSTDRLLAQLRDLGELRIRQIVPGTLHFDLNQIKVSLLHFPYPLLFPLQTVFNLNVADPRDIACMKVSAIASRGTRRDFVDLYSIARSHGLSKALDWFSRKFVSTRYSRVHLLKALVYFEDADREPMPDMLLPMDWTTVKTFFRAEVARLT